jgi:glycosyltransferase involved in cell wall biosynthesis
LSLKISIVTPSYNQGQFLEETLRSVLAQRRLIHEYFVFDGGSTDQSVDLIRKHAAQIDYWVSEKDRGQSDAIHKGFTRATGDILFWLNSDDVLLPGALSRVQEAFARQPDWDVLTGHSLWMDADSRIIRMHRMPAETPFWIGRGIMHVCQQTCYFKRSVYQAVGGVRLDLHCVMDGEMWLRMFAAGARWGHIPRYLGAFRRHPQSKWSSWLKEYRAEEAEMSREFPQFGGPRARRLAVRGAYGLTQLLSPQRWRAWADTRRYRGRLLSEVFPAETPATPPE